MTIFISKGELATIMLSARTLGRVVRVFHEESRRGLNKFKPQPGRIT